MSGEERLPEGILYQQEISRLREERDGAIADLMELANEVAEADASYHVAVSRRTLQLKSEGMPATVINRIIDGDDAVAPFRQQKIASELLNKATEKLVAAKMQDVSLVKAQMGYDQGRVFN